MDIIKNIENNLRERVKLLNECEKSDKLKQITMSICKKDIIYFFRYFVHTDRNPKIFPKEFGQAIPFIPFEFQEEFLIDAWDAIIMATLPPKDRTQPTGIFSEKSRQMGFSWLFAGLQLYAFIFHDMKSLYLTKVSDDVDRTGLMKSHFEKIRFMIRRLPEWILPKGLSKKTGSEHNKFMLISRKDGSGSISGESPTVDAGRGGTYNFVVLDEMASMVYAESINMSISEATDCTFYNSTPKGEGNEYYRMRRLAIGIDKYGKKIKPELRHHRCHWSEHPMYDEVRYKNKIIGKTPQQIAQELEIDYNIALEGRVYSEYSSGDYVLEYDYTLPLYVAIDNSHGGADPHAIIICQTDGYYWNILDACEFLGSPRDMAKIIARRPAIKMNNKQLDFYNNYKQMKPATYIADPYDTHSTVGDNTIFGYYQDEGIFLNIPNNRNKKQQIQKTQSNIHRIRANSSCSDFNSAIMNARYPEVKENSMRTTPADKPLHDETSHYRTALEYLVTFLLENGNDNKPKEKIAEYIKDPITGEMKVVYN